MTEAKLGLQVKTLKRRIVRANQNILMSLWDQSWPKQPTSMEALRKELASIVSSFKELFSFMNTKDSVFMQDEIYKASSQLTRDSHLQAKHNMKYPSGDQN